MRKIIAVLLAVLMLASVLAMVPAFAASYDGTTATSTGMHGLIITEIAQHTHEKDGLTQGAYNAAERAMYVDCAGYIEVLNNTGAAVDFSTLALLRGLNFNEAIDDTDDPMYKYVESWVSEKKFLQKMVLKTGNIISVAERDERYSDLFPDGDVKMTKVWESLENSADDFNVANGKAAVIWFVNEATVNWLKDERDKNLSGYDAREVFVDRFYGTDANAADCLSANKVLGVFFRLISAERVEGGLDFTEYA